MSTAYLIRPASLHDAAALLSIYTPYVTDTIISFEYEVPTLTDFTGRVQKVLQHNLPWLVAEHEGQVIGYAYAGVHNERQAYQWSADTSVYVQAGHHGRGVAQQLYQTLFDLLTRQGFVNAYAGISLPNPKSERFHQRFGFEPVGTYRQVGYKFGAWHDVQWLAKTLQAPPAAPRPPGPVPPLT